MFAVATILKYPPDVRHKDAWGITCSRTPVLLPGIVRPRITQMLVATARAITRCQVLSTLKGVPSIPARGSTCGSS